ncbi:glycosyltransferase family protein [Natronospora cellulosivora (SeqCode)]
MECKANDLKRVLVVAHIFPPVGGSGVQRTLKFVKYLKRYSWEPVVLTVGKTVYPIKDESLMTDIPNDISVIRIDESYQIDFKGLQDLVELYKGMIKDSELTNQYILQLFDGMDKIQSLLQLPDPYILWAKTVLDKIDQMIDINKIDMIYSTSGPFSDHIIAYYLKEKYQKAWVADFRDEWTNHPYVKHDMKSLNYKMQYELEDKVVKTADKIITVSSMISDNYRRIFDLEEEKLVTITNGYDEDDFKEIQENQEKNHHFTIAYNGLFSFDILPNTFLLALNNLINKDLIDKDKIKVKFTCQKNNSEWCKFIDKNQLSDIIDFIGYHPHLESLEKANQADLLLLIIGKGDKKRSVYSSKIFEYLRLNKDILSLAPTGGVVDKLLQETSRGMNVEIDDIDGIEEAILKYYKDWINNNQNNYSIDKIIKRYERIQLTNKLASVFNNILYCQEKRKINERKLIRKVLFIQFKPCIRTHKVARILSENGIQVDILYVDDYITSEYQEMDLPYKEIYKLRNISQSINFINNTNYDILYSSNEPDFLTALFNSTNKPIIHDTHDLLSLRQKLNNEQIILEYLANCQSDANIYVSNTMKEFAFKKFSLNNGKPIICFPNLMLREMLPKINHAKLRLQDNQIHCVYEGGLINDRNSHRFLEDIFLNLADNKIYVHFYTPNHLASLDKYFQALDKKSEYLSWEGSRDTKTLIEEMTKYDLGLCIFNINKANKSFLDTALPNKLFEYLGASLPVVTFDLKELKEFVTKYRVGKVLNMEGNIKEQLRETAKIKIEEGFLEKNKLLYDELADEIINFLIKVKKYYYK